MTHIRTPLRSAVGQRVKMAREGAGMTRRQVANEMHYTLQYINMMEHGECAFAAELLVDLSTLYNVPVCYFFEGVTKHGRS